MFLMCPLKWERPLIWWPKVESNHRHKDFQSSALPTELFGQEIFLSKIFKATSLVKSSLRIKAVS
jgi:hypothetical protein